LNPVQSLKVFSGLFSGIVMAAHLHVQVSSCIHC